MGRGLPVAVRRKAEELYVIECMPFDSIARETGVASSTLKRWARQYCWYTERVRFERGLIGSRVDTITLYREAVRKAKETMSIHDLEKVKMLYPLVKELLNREEKK